MKIPFIKYEVKGMTINRITLPSFLPSRAPGAQRAALDNWLVLRNAGRVRRVGA